MNVPRGFPVEAQMAIFWSPGCCSLSQEEVYIINVADAKEDRRWILIIILWVLRIHRQTWLKRKERKVMMMEIFFSKESKYFVRLELEFRVACYLGHVWHFAVRGASWGVGPHGASKYSIWDPNTVSVGHGAPWGPWGVSIIRSLRCGTTVDFAAPWGRKNPIGPRVSTRH